MRVLLSTMVGVGTCSEEGPSGGPTGPTKDGIVAKHRSFPRGLACRRRSRRRNSKHFGGPLGVGYTRGTAIVMPDKRVGAARDWGRAREAQGPEKS